MHPPIDSAHSNSHRTSLDAVTGNGAQFGTQRARNPWDPVRVLLPALLSMLCQVTPAAGFDAIEVVYGHAYPEVYALKSLPDVFPRKGEVKQFVAHGITFNLRYEDEDRGFMDPVTGAKARQCLRDVLAYVAEILDYSEGAIDIQVLNSEFDGSGPLASTGAVFPYAAGIHPGATLYRLNTGQKLTTLAPEMTLLVDFGRPFVFGDEMPGPNELDLVTVFLHEITHGVGFVSRMGPQGLSVSFPGGYSVFDALLSDRRGRPLLITDGIVPIFQGDPVSFTDFDVGFTGIHARAAYGEGGPAPISSAPPFRQGTSLSHWAFGPVVGDALMEGSLRPGDTIRAYTPLDLGAVIDIKNYSRGDGRPGDGPMGCAGTPTSTPARIRQGDAGMMGGMAALLLLLAYVGRYRIPRRLKRRRKTPYSDWR